MTSPLHLSARPLSPDEARRAAATILRGRRFQVERSPQPLRGALTWIGDRVRPLGRPFSWIVRQLNGVLPGGGSVVWIALVFVALAAATVIAIRFARARGRRAVAAERTTEPHRTAAELERLADEAERGGRLGEAVRFRFRAGLRRLGDGHALRIPEQRPNGDLVRQLEDPAFASLAARFDEIAYADRAGSASDVASAKQHWPTVITAGIAKSQRRQSIVVATAKKRWWRRRQQ